MKPLLEVKNLSVAFSNKGVWSEVVHHFCLTLYPHERVAIVGESGSGKSVTAKALMGLLPTHNCKVTFDAMSYQSFPLTAAQLPSLCGKEMGMIFQDPLTSLNPTMKIGKQIGEGVRYHFPNFTKNMVYLRTIELLKFVKISSPEIRFHQYPHELSGGMRQRVMIAIALSGAPQILFADEATTALDVTIQSQILQELKEIQAQMQMPIILITHDLSIVAGFCERVIVMQKGRIVEEGTVEEIFSSPKHPYTQTLLESIPSMRGAFA